MEFTHLVFVSALCCAFAFASFNADTTSMSLQGSLKLESIHLKESYRTILRNQNDSLSVSCFIENSTDTTLTWTGPNGKPLPVTDNRNCRKRVELIQTSPEKIYAKLVLENLNGSDTGTYVCNHPSQMSASFTLELFEPITFDETEKTQFAVIGTNYTVKCSPKIQGKEIDKVKVFWKINKRSIDFSRMTRLTGGLMINKIYKNDSDNEYICTAMEVDSIRPHSKRQLIKLIVLKQNFTESQMFGKLGERIRLPCVANSKSVFTWYGTSNQKIVPSAENQMCFIEGPTGETHILQTVLQSNESFGTYICIAESGNRTFGHKIRLIQANFVSRSFMRTDAECSPPLPTSTEKSDIGQVHQTIAADESMTELPNYYLLEESEISESDELKPQIESSTTTTKKSSTITTTTTVSTKTNEDGSTTVKTTIISEESTSVTTGKP